MRCAVIKGCKHIRVSDTCMYSTISAVTVYPWTTILQWLAFSKYILLIQMKQVTVHSCTSFSSVRLSRWSNNSRRCNQHVQSNTTDLQQLLICGAFNASHLLWLLWLVCVGHGLYCCLLYRWTTVYMCMYKENKLCIITEGLLDCIKLCRCYDSSHTVLWNLNQGDE